jgi:four helix bundle protein
VSRDHRKLRVFQLADELVEQVYRVSGEFPASERYTLKVQLRRAALSTACNIVEGSARRSTKEYLGFLNIAAGSAAETRYLVELSCRLKFIDAAIGEPLVNRYTQLCAQLHALISSLSPEP